MVLTEKKIIADFVDKFHIFQESEILSRGCPWYLSWATWLPKGQRNQRQYVAFHNPLGFVTVRSC